MKFRGQSRNYFAFVKELLKLLINCPSSNSPINVSTKIFFKATLTFWQIPMNLSHERLFKNNRYLKILPNYAGYTKGILDM